MTAPRCEHRWIDCRYLRAAVLAAALVPLCWLAMQIVHEVGHVLGAWVTGGRVTAVVLHPLAISRTDVSPNPRPLVVVWSGPLVGSVVPVVCWATARLRRWASAYLWRFFAGFCLVANGVYLGYGVVEPVGDAHDILRYGGHVWQLAAFAVATSIAGIGLWNGQGLHFGVGRDGTALPLRHVALTWGCLLIVIVGEVLWTQQTGFK